MRHTIHKLIYWYVKKCGGAFHCYNYGHQGRYVIGVNESEYAEFAKHIRRSAQNHKQQSCY